MTNRCRQDWVCTAIDRAEDNEPGYVIPHSPTTYLEVD
jgi:hypothetical protein